VAHHGHLVQRRLTVEQHIVAVVQVSIHNVAGHELRRQHVAIRVAQRLGLMSAREPHILGTRPHIGAIAHDAAHLLDVEIIDLLGERQVHSNLDWHTQLIQTDVRIRRDDGTRTLIHTLAIQVATNAPLLLLETIRNRLEAPTIALLRRWQTRNLIVDERGDMILQDLRGQPHVFFIHLRLLQALLELVVGLHNVAQLMGEVVFAPLPILLNDRRPHSWRRHDQHLTDHPLRTVPLGIETKQLHVALCNALENAQHVLGRQLARFDFRIRLLDRIFPLCNNSQRPLLAEFRRLAGAAATRCLVIATVFDFVFTRNEFKHGVVALGQILDALRFENALLNAGILRFRRRQNSRAAETHAFQKLLDVVVKHGVENGARELDVTKVAGAENVFLLASGTGAAVLQHAHTRVEQATGNRIVAIVRVSLGDLDDRATLNFLWTQHTKLNALYHVDLLIVRELLVNGHDESLCPPINLNYQPDFLNHCQIWHDINFWACPNPTHEHLVAALLEVPSVKIDLRCATHFTATTCPSERRADMETRFQKRNKPNPNQPEESGTLNLAIATEEEIDDATDTSFICADDSSDDDYDPDDDSEMTDDHIMDEDTEADEDDTDENEDSDEAQEEDDSDDEEETRRPKTIVPMRILEALRHRAPYLMLTHLRKPGTADADDDDDEDILVSSNAKKRKFNEGEALFRKFLSKYTKEEQNYLRGLTPTEIETIKASEKVLEERNSVPDVPLRFKILTSAMDLGCKRLILQRLDQFQKMNEGAGEYFKLSNWLQFVCRLPLGIYHPLPVTPKSGRDQIATFLQHTKSQLDAIVYGHADAKNQLLRILAQWISNPSSGGHCIGIHGPPGIGKTSLIKNGISKALGLPFAFVALGGASDASFLDGHAFTYEGSMYGKIAEVLMRTQCMNPVIFFDELDKVSETNKGEEISHVLTHLTDSTQNDRFNDKYFGEIDLDLSKALMVFSFNHEEKIDPILKDRMITIEVKGFDVEDKLRIARNFLLPTILAQFGFGENDVLFFDEILRAIIQRVPEEHGVRNFKRGIEAIASWINMYQYVPPPNTAPITLPYVVTEDCIKKMIFETNSAKSAAVSTMYM